MDKVWKTSDWDWNSSSDEDKRKGMIALFRCRPGDAIAVNASLDKGSLKPNFTETTLQTQENWDSWLSNIPQPQSSTADGSLNLLLCPRAPDTKVGNTTLRNPLNLKHVPLPDPETFIRLIETFHIHQATQTIINRGWPTIIRIEGQSGPDSKITFILRTANALEHDTALTITHVPSKRLTYAIALGYTKKQIETICERLTFSEHAALEPFTLINTFLHIEKRYRFEQVEGPINNTRLFRNWQFEAALDPHMRTNPVLEDDPSDLVGLAAEVRFLMNGLVSWIREMERFKARVHLSPAEFPRCVNGDEKYPLLDAGEYLERTVDEYGAMVRRCETLLEHMSMIFQMETSNIARQEVKKMKGLAILTMVFLPATFVATFMSMGLFNWHPEEGEDVMSPYWWIYFAITGGLTLLVFICYFFWSPLPSFHLSNSRERSDFELV